MRLQFKHQKFQADAARAVVDVFAGRPYLTPSYMMDRVAIRALAPFLKRAVVKLPICRKGVRSGIQPCI